MKWILSLAIGMLVVACGEPTRNLTVTNSKPSTITDVKVNVNGRQFYPLGDTAAPFTSISTFSAMVYNALIDGDLVYFNNPQPNGALTAQSVLIPTTP